MSVKRQWLGACHNEVIAQGDLGVFVCVCMPVRAFVCMSV